MYPLDLSFIVPLFYMYCSLPQPPSNNSTCMIVKTSHRHNLANTPAFPPITCRSFTSYCFVSVNLSGIIVRNFFNSSGNNRWARRPVNTKRYMGYRFPGAKRFVTHCACHSFGMVDSTTPVLSTTHDIKCRPLFDLVSMSKVRRGNIFQTFSSVLAYHACVHNVAEGPEKPHTPCVGTKKKV